MKKGCVIASLIGGTVVLFCGGGIAAIVVLLFQLTGGAVDAGNEFLALLGEGKTNEAYQATDTSFRDRHDEAAFAAVIDQLGLDRYESSHWNNRSINNNVATLDGTISTASGDSRSLTMTLVNQNGAWRVSSLSGEDTSIIVDDDESVMPTNESPVVGDPATIAAAPQESGPVVMQEAPPAGPVPSDDEAKALVKQYILALNQGLQDGDMTAFHASVSTALQGLATPEVFHDDLSVLKFQRVDLTAIATSAIEFARPPAIDEDGELDLAGQFQSADTEVRFFTYYVYEAEQWKLRRITVQAVPNDDTIPAADMLQQLVKQSLLQFSQSIQAKDFTEFHGTVSETMQQQFTPDELTSGFSTFILLGLDLSSIQDTELTFSQSPFINDEGVLEIHGGAPFQADLQFVYRLTYLREGTEWKLLGISGNITGG